MIGEAAVQDWHEVRPGSEDLIVHRKAGSILAVPAAASLTRTHQPDDLCQINMQRQLASSDKLPAAPRSQWYRDETKYVERNHDDMKPEDRLSYIDWERCVHLMADSL